MEENEMAEMLVKMFETRICEIEMIVDLLNNIDRDFLWDVDESDLNDALSVLNDAVRSAKKESRRRK